MKSKIIACLFFGYGLAAFSSPHVATEDSPDAGVAADTMISQVMELDGRQVEYWVHRVPGAQATVVFENGLMLPMTTWQRVTPAFTANSNMLAYNRPGVGRSAEVDSPSDPAGTAEQLWQLLQAQHLPPPYVLVGHSLGGQYVQLFAERYPDQVSALLLVDALPIGVAKPVEAFPWYTRMGLALFAPSYVQREVEGIYPMGEIVLADREPFDKPMIRLVAVIDPPPPPPQGLIKDLLNGVLYAEDFGVWLVDPEDAERRMDVLYPQSVVRHVPAVHRIQESTPDVVIASLHELIANH